MPGGSLVHPAVASFCLQHGLTVDEAFDTGYSSDEEATDDEEEEVLLDDRPASTFTSMPDDLDEAMDWAL